MTDVTLSFKPAGEDVRVVIAHSIMDSSIDSHNLGQQISTHLRANLRSDVKIVKEV